MMIDTSTHEFRSRPRGSERTLEWVRSLPKPCPRLVVHTHAMANFLRQMLCDVRPDLDPGSIPIMVISHPSDCDRLRGAPFDVDHATWDTLLLSSETKDMLLYLYRAQRSTVKSASKPDHVQPNDAWLKI